MPAIGDTFVFSIISSVIKSITQQCKALSSTRMPKRVAQAEGTEHYNNGEGSWSATEPPEWDGIQYLPYLGEMIIEKTKNLDYMCNVIMQGVFSIFPNTQLL